MNLRRLPPPLLAAVLPSLAFAQMSVSKPSPTSDVSNNRVTTTGANKSGALKDHLSGSLNVRIFGAKGDGVTDDTAAIQEAINVAAGKELYFPPGTYLYSTTLVLRNGTIYRGSGKRADGTTGTILKYTGTSDAVQISNPVNSFTAADITIRDMLIFVVTRAAGKAAISDVGSSHLHIVNVGIGASDYGIILDQTEVSVVEKTEIHPAAGGSTAAIWLVNGAEHTVGANAGYTNRITIKECQLALATTGSIIADDGGWAHVYENNNFVGGANQIRVTGASPVITGNEFEESTNAVLLFATTKLGGGSGSQSPSATVAGNLMITGGAYAVSSSASALAQLRLENNVFSVIVGGGKPVPAAPASLFSSFGNISLANADGSILTTANYVAKGYASQDFVAPNNLSTTADTSILPAWSPAWTASVTSPVLGNGTVSSSWSRNGSLVTATVMITAGSTTTFGSGTYWVSIPVQETQGVAWFGTAFAFDSSAGAVYEGVAYLAPNETRVRFWFTDAATSNANPTVPFTWAQSDQLGFTLTYSLRARD